jgi:2-hydroxychromene-2-carboxylate isomerase
MGEVMGHADIRFYFDPVCPFAWMTSKWVRLVQSRRGYAVEWRTISLRMLNAHIDYDAHFPPEYEAGHTAGLRLLRVVHAARAEHGPEAVGGLYEALGRNIFDAPPPDEQIVDDVDVRGTAEFLAPVLDELGLPRELVRRLDDESLDIDIGSETDEALALTGKDVGTPIIHFEPPDGVAFFGPVISRLPDEDDAVRLWDHVVGLASFPGFTELKRSLRELPQLRGLGVDEREVGTEQDWHAGSRPARQEVASAAPDC